MGPYIPTWMEGAASWHPSVIGHRLRAAHHSYFWLLILSDAIQGLKSSLTHRVIGKNEENMCSLYKTSINYSL